MLEDSHKDSNRGWQNLPEADNIVFSGDDAFFEEAWGGIQEQLPKPSRAIGLGWLTLGILLLLSPFIYRGGTTSDVAPIHGQVMAQSDVDGSEENKSNESFNQDVEQGNSGIIEAEDNNEVSVTKEIDEFKPAKVRNDDIAQAPSTAAQRSSSLPAVNNGQAKTSMPSGRIESNRPATSLEKEGPFELLNNAEAAIIEPSLRNTYLTRELPLVMANLDHDQVQLDSPDDLIFTSAKAIPRVWVGGYVEYGQNQWLGQSNMGSYNSIDYELTSGYWREAGIKLALPLTARQSVEFRLGYGIQRLAAHYDLSVDYGSTGEYSDGMGNLHKNYEHTLNTLVGEMDLKHVLYRNETDRLQEGEQVGFTLSVEQDLDIIPMGLSYLYDIPLAQSLFLQGGLGLDASFFRNQVQGTTVSLKSHHRMMHHNYTEINAHSSHTAQPWMLSASVSVGLGYDWRAYRLVLNAQVQETIVEPELNLGAHLHPTLLTGSLSVLRAF